MSKQTQLSKRRAAGLLVAMGVVYGGLVSVLDDDAVNDGQVRDDCAQCG